VAATERLNAIDKANPTPWKLTSSFGRARPAAAMKSGAGAQTNL
jgi:fructose-bisphosphate aldolase class 1